MHPSQSRTLLLATDGKNSVLTEMAGRLNRLAYSAYGRQSSEDKVMTCMGFNGVLREAGVGWYILGNGYRAYNPILMRFHSPDSFSPFGKGEFNAYMYCGGEPMMRTDPSGEAWFKVFAWFNEIFSGVGPTGGVVSKSKPMIQPVKEVGFLAAASGVLKRIDANKRPPIARSSGGSRRHAQPSWKGSQFGARTNSAPPSPTQPSVNTQAAETSRGRPGLVLEGNYGSRDQNAYTTVKTTAGLNIKGVDSGKSAIASTSGVSENSRIRR